MRVELPDGRIAEFPDDMDKDQIKAVLREKFPIQQSQPSVQPQDNKGYERQGLAGIAVDAGESLLSAPGALLKMAMDIPEQLQNLGQYRLEHGLLPTLGQSALGVGELGAGIFNLPYQSAQYLKRKGIPIAKDTADYVPHIPVQKIEEKLGLLPKEKGELEARGVGQLFAGGGILSKIPSTTARVGALSGMAAGQDEDPIHAAIVGLFGEKAMKAPKKIKENREIRDWSMEELKGDLNTQNKTIDTLQKIDELNKKMAEIPDPSTKLPDNRFESNYQNLQNMSRESSTALEQANRAQAEQLGHLQDFQTRAAPIVIQHVQGVKNQISPRYDAINNAAQDISIPVPNESRAREIQEQLNNMVEQGIASPMNDKIYDSIFSQLQEQWPGEAINDIPAPQYINTYKSTRDLANIARTRSRQEGLTQDIRQRWEQQANRLEPIVQQQRELLSEYLPDNLFNDLLETDRLWSQNVMPFYRNKIYREARQNGRVPENMIDVTAGNAPHQTIMQQAIQSNPELNRLAIGQKYASRPHELLTANERIQPYIDAHTPTQNLLEVQRRAHTTNQQIQENLNQLEPERQFRQLQQKGVADEVSEQLKQRRKTEEQINNLIQELQQINKDAKSIEEEIKKRGLTEERIKKRQEYEKKQQKLKNRLWEIIKAAGGAAIAIDLKSVLTALFK